MTQLVPIQYIGDPIQVQFDRPPLFEKKPDCPDGFVWKGESFRIAELLWQKTDYQRRGRMARNMQPQHAAVASQRGSWGVGRFSFRVRTTVGRIFEIYYDRAPKDVDSRKGEWILTGEFVERDEPDTEIQES